MKYLDLIGFEVSLRGGEGIFDITLKGGEDIFTRLLQSCHMLARLPMQVTIMKFVANVEEKENLLCE